MKHDDVTCERLVLECLLEFEEEAMPEEERRELQLHFDMCFPCLSFLATYRATGKCLKMLKPTEIPPALAQTVMAFVRARREKEKG
jgi:hypothetical protein